MVIEYTLRDIVDISMLVKRTVSEWVNRHH